MDIILSSIPHTASSYDVTRAIALVLHGEAFVSAHCPDDARPVNFKVILAPDHVPNSIRNAGHGILTLPEIRLGVVFLEFLKKRRIRIQVANRSLRLDRSQTTIPRAALIKELKHVPFQDPDVVESKVILYKSVQTSIPIRTLQFGVFFRAGNGVIFSPEWEEDYQQHGDARLAFEIQHSLLRITIGDHTNDITRSVLMTFVNLKDMYMGWEMGSPFILFHLSTPSALEWEDKNRPETRRTTNTRFRVGAFDAAHERIAPYAHQVRLVLKDGDDLKAFSAMCCKAQILIPKSVRPGQVDVQRRNIYSDANLRKIDNWIMTLDFPVAFQCEALLRNLRLNACELLDLRPDIDSQVQRRPLSARDMLRHFHTVLRSRQPNETILDAFNRAIQEYDQLCLASDRKSRNSNPNFFEAHHVSFTPTAVRLEGPYTHQSNRVLRSYLGYQDYFIRADFRDENRLQYKWDREVDGAEFVRERVGSILHHGFKVAGRRFEFLGYSQSQLRSHAIFAVAPFQHPEKGLVTADSIRKEVGIFKEVLHCPALYAARVSQAFSGTEDSVRLRANEWEKMDDIKHNGRCFTDGVGTISPLLARAIWERLCEQRGRKNFSGPFSPIAFQIRFGGYKGMVAVDPRLSGIMMRLRGSMRKFDVHENDNIPIEISRAFEYPGKMFLNRPLIQILEDLGIHRNVFLELQSAAVTDAQTARDSLRNFARFLDSHALGRAFSLSYIVKSLEAIGCDMEHHNPSWAVGKPFLKKLADIAIFSVLLDIKHHARIPVPQGWNLPGIADEEGILNRGEIYACIWEQHATQPFWLEGSVMISRSPTIHPGDVQMVYAIGKPPRGSIYEQNPMPNTVIFPVKGKRDLASCLAGGDLDGDLYLVTQLPGLLVPFDKVHPPGDYPPTVRKDIGRPSTIEDVADFVVEYINSDMVGLLSTNHLILSDQSSFGTRDPACLKLAELCSRTVDYPKSGIPVKLEDIPRFLIPFKPDWKRDGADVHARKTEYYHSFRAIGYLYRAITIERSSDPIPSDPEKENKKAKDKLKSTSSSPPEPPVESIILTLTPLIEQHLARVPTARDHVWEDVPQIFRRYCLELKYICVTHTLAHDIDAQLSEEEVVIGTILAQCTQNRWRKDRIEQLRINAGQLIYTTSAELKATELANKGHNNDDVEEARSPPYWKLAKAWAAWKHARANTMEYGHHSFGLIALEAVFKALDELKEN